VFSLNQKEEKLFSLIKVIVLVNLPMSIANNEHMREFGGMITTMKALTSEQYFYYDRGLEEVINECRRITKFFKNNKAAACLRRVECKQKPRLPVETRWSSNIYVLNSYLITLHFSTKQLISKTAQKFIHPLAATSKTSSTKSLQQISN